MAIPDHILYWLDRADNMVAAELPASQDDRRAWVGVYPRSRSNNFYTIRHFEVRKELLEHDYDIGEADLLQSERFSAADEEELERILSRWLSDFNKLVRPYFCDYPI